MANPSSVGPPKGGDYAGTLQRRQKAANAMKETRVRAQAMDGQAGERRCIEIYRTVSRAPRIQLAAPAPSGRIVRKAHRTCSEAVTTRRLGAC
jgi:hypothetical protein